MHHLIKITMGMHDLYELEKVRSSLLKLTHVNNLHNERQRKKDLSKVNLRLKCLRVSSTEMFTLRF